MELERLAQALGPVEVVNPAAADVRELAYDARRVEPGTLFFCVRGAQADGHEFAAEAVANGAAALVVEHPLDLQSHSSSSPMCAPRCPVRPWPSSAIRPPSSPSRA